MIESKEVGELCLVLLRHNILADGRVPEATADLRSLEPVGIKVVYSTIATPSRELMTVHYQKDDAWLIRVGDGILDFRKKKGLLIDFNSLEYGQRVLQSLIDYNSDKLMKICILFGIDACAQARRIVGSINEPGTMRAKYSRDSDYEAALNIRATQNSVHCSGNAPEAIVEIGNLKLFNLKIDFMSKVEIINMFLGLN